MNEGIVDYCLVVCPSPLKYATWRKEIEKWTDEDYVIVDGSKPQEVEWEDGTVEKLSGRELREVQYQQWYHGTRFIVMNYELFLHDSETERWEKYRELTKPELVRLEELKQKHGEEAKYYLADELVKKGALPQGESYTIRKNGKKYSVYRKVAVKSILPPVNHRWAVILDECHRIKNPRAETTKRLKAYLAPAGRKILATGTPLENNLEELWSLVDFCRPGLLGNYYQFRHRYLELDRWGSVVAPKPYMLPELKQRLEPIILRKTKEEALPDLPELTVQEYWVEMTPVQKKLYEKISEGIIEFINNEGEEDVTYLEVLAQLTRLQQVCDSPALLREVFHDETLPVESGKLNELRNIIEDLNPQKNKFILFSQYKQMTDILYGWMIQNNILPKTQIGYIKGGMKASETERIQKGFQEGDIQCIIMTTAGNYGLDLSAGSYIICYDQLFNPQKMEQIYSRCHRNGAKNAITAINLVTQDTYEERKLRILEKKRELFKAVIDSDEELLRKAFSSKEELLALI